MYNNCKNILSPVHSLLYTSSNPIKITEDDVYSKIHNYNATVSLLLYIKSTVIFFIHWSCHYNNLEQTCDVEFPEYN